MAEIDVAADPPLGPQPFDGGVHVDGVRQSDDGIRLTESRLDGRCNLRLRELKNRESWRSAWRVANSVSEKIDAGTEVSSDWSRGFPSLSLRYRL